MYLHLFSGVCRHHRQFSSCSQLPHQPTAGTEGISHRLSPAWTWSQKELSVAVYAVLSPPNGIKNESSCPKQGTRSLWSVPQVPCAPLSYRFLCQPSCGCQFFLPTAGAPDLRHTLFFSLLINLSLFSFEQK